MTKEQDLSSFAAFDLNDLLAEISQSSASKKEVTAYLDRTFLMNMINEYHEQTKLNDVDYTVDKKIDITEYNFTGADFRGIPYSDFALFDFRECDITAVKLDRNGVNFFRELILNGKVTAMGLNLDGAYLGPLLSIRQDLGIECYIYLSFSNMDLTGTTFRQANIEGLILENTNISGCEFIDCINMDPKQFAFSIGFESAIFYRDEKQNDAIKAKIKDYANTLDPESYNKTAHPQQSKFAIFLSKISHNYEV